MRMKTEKHDFNRIIKGEKNWKLRIIDKERKNKGEGKTSSIKLGPWIFDQKLSISGTNESIKT